MSSDYRGPRCRDCRFYRDDVTTEPFGECVHPDRTCGAQRAHGDRQPRFLLSGNRMPQCRTDWGESSFEPADPGTRPVYDPMRSEFNA